MTDLQDDICDRLVGQNIGPNWVGGPLHVAALVIDPTFIPETRGDKRPSQFARAVGWPVVFCEAVIGANAVLGKEDDRRSLAISLFTRLPPVRPGQGAVPIPAGLSRAAVEWAVLRGHELACGVDCPLHGSAVAALQSLAAGGKWRNPFRGGKITCRSAPRKQDKRVKPTSTPAHHAVVALRYLNVVMTAPRNHHALADAMRESAKAVTKVRGLKGAVKFCLALAEKLGLSASLPVKAKAGAADSTGHHR
jgi:hypothetical protein